MFREQGRTDDQFPELREEESYAFKGEMPEVGEYVMVEWCETFEAAADWTKQETTSREKEEDIADQFFDHHEKYEGIVTVGVVVESDCYGYMAVARDSRDRSHGGDRYRRVIWIPYRAVLEICPLRPDPIDGSEGIIGALEAVSEEGKQSNMPERPGRPVWNACEHDHDEISGEYLKKMWDAEANDKLTKEAANDIVYGILEHERRRAMNAHLPEHIRDHTPDAAET